MTKVQNFRDDSKVKKSIIFNKIFTRTRKRGTWNINEILWTTLNCLRIIARTNYIELFSVWVSCEGDDSWNIPQVFIGAVWVSGLLVWLFILKKFKTSFIFFHFILLFDSFFVNKVLMILTGWSRKACQGFMWDIFQGCHVTLK